MRGKIISLVVLLLVWGGMAKANYDPTNPPEPNVYNKLTVAVTPTEAGTASGAGHYQEGTSVTVRCSGKTGYTFSHWTLNGEVFGGATTTSFTYLMGDSVANFVAVYTKDPYDPTNPDEPYMTHYGRVYLESTPAGCCSFNRTSGAKLVAGTSITVASYASQGYVFNGWYEGDVKLSSSTSFTYVVPEGTVTLTAKYTYDPSNPLEPDGSEEGIDNPGLTTPTDVTDEVRPLKVYVSKGRIVVENATEEVTVYNLIGGVVKRARGENAMRIEVPTEGIYLVRIGDRTTKVVVR